MQKVLPVAGGINAYVASPDCLLSHETRRCPLCSDHHPLRIHGWYWRYALLPGSPEGEAPRIRVLRLLCARLGRTVSLLPDFCLPRRQQGPAILALFLQALVQGLSLLQALRQTRAEVASHSVAQNLLRGFLSRRTQILVYLGGLRARSPEPAISPGRDPWRLALLVDGLCEGWDDPGRAFEVRARGFHDRFGLGLA
jgi:hypothetical protein